MKKYLLSSAATLFMVTATTLHAKDSQLVSYTAQWQAFAPNAGGQTAYGLRRSTDTRELGVFMNEYLLANGAPLFGASYDMRFPVCGGYCPLQAYGQAGAGLSSGGVFAELGWSITALWVARVDFTTQIFFSKTRLISWSYPLWLGVSIPFP